MNSKYTFIETTGNPGEIPIIIRNNETGEEKKYYQIMGVRETPPSIYDPETREYLTYGNEVFDALWEYLGGQRAALEKERNKALGQKYKGKLPE